jgi:threonine dehydratase
MAAGKPVDTPTKPTLADGLAVPKVGANAFSVSHHLIDRMVTVSEKAIALSVLRLCELEKIVVEGGIHIQKWIIIIIIIMVAMIRRCGRLGSTH